MTRQQRSPRGSHKTTATYELVYEVRDNPKTRERTLAARNVRESPLDLLYVRGNISLPQFEAAARYRRDWELAQIGSVSVPDLGRVLMKTKGGYVGLSDARLDALQRLNDVRGRLSRVAAVLLDAICVERKRLTDMANVLGIPANYVGYRFREALSDLADIYEALDGVRPRRFRDETELGMASL